jgi:hypothetical protein
MADFMGSQLFVLCNFDEPAFVSDFGIFKAYPSRFIGDAHTGIILHTPAKHAEILEPNLNLKTR